MGDDTGVGSNFLLGVGLGVGGGEGGGVRTEGTRLC